MITYSDNVLNGILTILQQANIEKFISVKVHAMEKYQQRYRMV